MITAPAGLPLPAGISELRVWSVPMRTRFRGIDVRDGVLVRGPAGWGEFSPFWDYDVTESRRWWAAAVESAVEGWPAPVRTSVPVNVTVPAVDAERAHAIVRSSGCRTAKVKVAEPGQTPADDLARVEAV
ncbi:MAG TPA: O-succinylbenzoate synthase, partial [Mycobacteriales bacterium]|nr:O-succinylbenzoate synthase [Mycobacteriales bacterium]